MADLLELQQKYNGKGAHVPLITWLKKADGAGVGLVVPDQTFVLVNFDTIIQDNVGGFDGADPGQIYMPDWASWVRMEGHVTFRPQLTPGAVDGVARAHLFRNNSSTNDAHYHTIFPYRVGYTPPGGPPYSDWLLSFPAETPWIPRELAPEKWSLYVWQNTGQPAILNLKLETWYHCEFK